MVESPGKITLWGIEIFMATADERSISAAARRLGASPSTVSQQLTNLESAVGATLLERNARPVRLTKAGEYYFPNTKETPPMLTNVGTLVQRGRANIWCETARP